MAKAKTFYCRLPTGTGFVPVDAEDPKAAAMAFATAHIEDGNHDSFNDNRAVSVEVHKFGVFDVRFVRILKAVDATERDA